MLIVGDVGFGLLGLSGGKAFRALGPLQITLQNVIGTLANGFARALFDEELLAQGAPAQTIDALDLLKNLLPLAA